MHAEDMLRPPQRPKNRARERARDILDRQYEGGLAVLRHAWAQDALRQIERACPSLTHEETVRLFSRRTSGSAETVLQAALFLEWNRTHGGAPPPAPSKKAVKAAAGRARKRA